MKRIALLGPGTFSEESAKFFFSGEQHEFVPYKLISDVFLAAASGETDLGIVPIENTIEGSVHLDWLVHEVDLPILAEWVYPIVMNLIGNAAELHQSAAGSAAINSSGTEARYARIRKIVSYPIAVAQCQQFVRSGLPNAEIEQAGSTAEGVKYVSSIDTWRCT